MFKSLEYEQVVGDGGAGKAPVSLLRSSPPDNPRRHRDLDLLGINGHLASTTVEDAVNEVRKGGRDGPDVRVDEFSAVDCNAGAGATTVF